MGKNKAARKLGKLGGKKRWEGIGADERKAIMQRVLRARWDKGRRNGG